MKTPITKNLKPTPRTQGFTSRRGAVPAQVLKQQVEEDPIKGLKNALKAKQVAILAAQVAKLQG